MRLVVSDRVLRLDFLPYPHPLDGTARPGCPSLAFAVNMFSFAQALAMAGHNQKTFRLLRPSQVITTALSFYTKRYQATLLVTQNHPAPNPSFTHARITGGLFSLDQGSPGTPPFCLRGRAFIPLHSGDRGWSLELGGLSTCWKTERH